MLGHLPSTSFYHNSKNGQTVSDLLNDNARSEPTIYFLTCVQQWILLVNKQNYSIPIQGRDAIYTVPLVLFTGVLESELESQDS